MKRVVLSSLGCCVAGLIAGCGGVPIESGAGGFDDGGPSVNASSSVGDFTPPPWAPAYTSGSRLRARVVDAGGQARSFVGWFDSTLGIDCVSTPVSGEPNRCLPPRIDAVVYLDDACTEAAASLPAVSGEEVPPFVVEEHAGDQLCGSFRGWVVGAEQTVATVYERGPGGVCTAVTEEATVRALSPIELEAFAPLEVTSEVVNGLLWRRVERGPDGSFRALSGLDAPNGDACQVFAAPFESSRPCLPNARVRRSKLYADGACGERAIALDACELNALTPIVDVLEDACLEPTPQLYAAGEIVDVLFTKDGACEPGVAGKGRKLGAKLDLNPPSADSALVPGERLTLLLDAFVGVALRADGVFARNDDFALCEARTTPIGTRCIPRLILHGHTYADAACTTKVVPLAPTQCPTPELVGVRAPDGSIEHVHSLGAVVSGQIYSDVTGGCEPVSSSDSAWYGLGAEVPLHTFDVLASFVE